MGVVMLLEKELAQEFTRIVDQYYPQAGEVLHHCYVKVIDSDLKRLGKRFYYLAIYCPNEIFTKVQEHKDVYKEIAENMGLVEVVYINATRLLRDPKSKLKQENPRFWLELHWIATQHLN